MKFHVFDKVKWHTGNGMSLKNASKHINAIMVFLKSNNLLSEEGIEIFEEDGIDEEFSLNSDLLLKRGETFLLKHYKNYLKDYEKLGEEPSIILLEKNLKNEN